MRSHLTADCSAQYDRTTSCSSSARSKLKLKSLSTRRPMPCCGHKPARRDGLRAQVIPCATQSHATLWLERLVGLPNASPCCIGLVVLASTASTTALLAEPRTPPLADSPYSVRLRQWLELPDVSKGPLNASHLRHPAGRWKIHHPL